jgi:hypothetical protein
MNKAIFIKGTFKTANVQSAKSRGETSAMDFDLCLPSGGQNGWRRSKNRVVGLLREEMPKNPNSTPFYVSSSSRTGKQ